MPGMTLEIYPGESIEEASKTASHIANALRLDVDFEFNGIRIYALFGESDTAVRERYYRFFRARSEPQKPAPPPSPSSPTAPADSPGSTQKPEPE